MTELQYKQRLVDFYSEHIDEKKLGYLDVTDDVRLYVDAEHYKQMRDKSNYTVLEYTYVSYQIRGVNVSLCSIWHEYPLIDEVMSILTEEYEKEDGYTKEDEAYDKASFNAGELI